MYGFMLLVALSFEHCKKVPFKISIQGYSRKQIMGAFDGTFILPHHPWDFITV